ncbi:hypothetical protein yrohd0001_13180 [Yersinia rohdei ATCC 43380]|nr:hypothetical protein yrohd0001_13180 [Yersinia rohdei ATCC 43380]
MRLAAMRCLLLLRLTISAVEKSVMATAPVLTSGIQPAVEVE